MRFKACRLTIEGSTYLVNKNGVVAKCLGEDSLLASDKMHMENVEFCDSATTDAVIAEVMRRRAIKAREKANANRRARDGAMRDMGMVKVRGCVSGSTYWE